MDKKKKTIRINISSDNFNLDLIYQKRKKGSNTKAMGTADH